MATPGRGHSPIAVKYVSMQSPRKIVVRQTASFLEKRLEKLERELFQSLKNRTESDSDESFEANSHVAVESDQFPNRRRGIIVEINESVEVTLYGLFLYDYGIYCCYERSSIKLLPMDFILTISPVALVVILPGLVPCKVLGRARDGTVFSVPAQDWDEETNEFVKAWMQERPIQLLKMVPIDDVSVCGDFYQEGYKEGLVELLLNCNRAKFDDSDFAKLMEVPTEPIPDSSRNDRQTPSTDHGKKIFADSSRCGVGVLGKNNGAAGSSGKQPLQNRGASGDTNEVLTANREEEIAGAWGFDPEKVFKKPSASKHTFNNTSLKDEEKSKAPKAAIPIPMSGIRKCGFAKIRGSELVVNKLEDRSNEQSAVQKNAAYIDTAIPSLPVKVLVRGNDVLPPYNQIENFPLHGFVEKALQCDLQIFQINQLQRTAWPHVLRGRNCFIVGGQSKKKGKSLSYIVPIVATVLSGHANNSAVGFKTNGTGPIGLFICSSMFSGEKLKAHLDHFLGKTKIQSLLSVAPGGDFWYRLRDNPEFVITTPEFLLTLIEEYSNWFGFERLRYIVFDDSHLLLKYKLEAVTKIVQALSHFLEKIEKRPFALQTIFCGQQWNREMEAALQKITFEPVLIMASSFQAIAFGGVKVQIHFVTSEEKVEALIDLIEDQVKTRAVIVCQKQETVVQLGVSLCRQHRLRGVKTMYLPIGNVTSEMIQGTKNEWLLAHPNEMAFIICTDSDLREFNLQNVDKIIHFEMPATKHEAFGDRHLCMWNFFPHIVAAADGDYKLSKQTNLISHVFLTHEEPDLCKIVKQFRKIGVKIPDDLAEIAELANSEEMKKARLCESFKQFGMCSKYDKLDCEQRHFFNVDEINEESIVPKTGRIEIEIMRCEKVNVFRAKLHHYYVNQNNRKMEHISFLNVLKRREEELAAYYSVESNRAPLTSVKKRTLCALKPNEGEGDSYTRGEIECVIQVSEIGHPVQVRVFCIDTGFYAVRNVVELFALPEKFARYHKICLEIILADLKPSFGAEQFKNGDNLKTRHLTEGRIYTALIALCIGSTIWVKKIAESDSTGRSVHRSLRKQLKSANCAVDNPNHLECLYARCEEVGFKCSMYKIPESVGQECTEIFYLREPLRWAYLPTESLQNPKSTQVWSTCMESPYLIYVRLDKFWDLLNNLNEELESHILSLILGKYADYASKFYNYYEEGMCVVAQTRQEKLWNRAVITRIHADEEGVKLFDVFFVDHGDKETGMKSFELFPIPKKFVSQLPFQAIALRLNHIYPKGLEENGNEPRVWGNDVCDVLFKKMFADDGRSESFDVIALERLSKTTEGAPLCEYYDSYVLTSDKELGEFLVDLDHANYYSGMEASVQHVKKAILDKLCEMVERNLHFSDGDDDDDDDLAENYDLPNIDEFDVYMGEGDRSFMNSLLPDLAKTNGGFPFLPAVQDANLPSTSHSVRAQLSTSSSLNDVNSNISASPGSSKNATQAKKGTSPPRSPGNIPSTQSGLSKPKLPVNPEPGDHLMKPSVKWTQTVSTVTIKILIPDMKKYSVQLAEDKRLLTFTSDDPPNYGFEFNFFGKVRPPLEEKLLGQYLAVTGKKLTPAKWTQVSREDKNWWLKHDLDNLDSDDSDDSDPNWGGSNDDNQMRGNVMKNKESSDKPKLSYDNIPIDFEGDCDDDDSYSSDSEIDDEAGTSEVDITPNEMLKFK